MVQIRQLLVGGAAAAAALALLAPPANAASTTVVNVDAGGTPYSGAVDANLLGVATVDSSIGGGSCNQSTMTGSVGSDGTGLTITGVTFANNGGPCAGTFSSTITGQNLPWTGGNATYAPVAGGRDGTVTISNFRVRAVVNVFGGITCIFGGNLTANAYNSTNPNRPVTSNNESQVSLSSATVNKINSGSHWFCPSTASVTGTYQLTGAGGATLGLTS